MTGADIIRISRTLALEPWHFTDSSPAAVDDPTSIVVDGGRRRVNLKLANAAHGCIFMVKTLSGASICGIGDLAPTSCRAYPANLPTNTLSRSQSCRCTEWSEQDIDQDRLAEAQREWAADRDHWYQVVARWNAIAARSGESLGLEDFQRYVLEAQTAREAGADWPEEVAA